jgi:DNA transposition AAA+ family ATPase
MNESLPLLAAWALPTEGPLTDDQRRAALQNFAEYCKRNKITVKTVADQVGTPSEITIRGLCKGVFGDGADEHVRRVNTWVEQHAKMEGTSLPFQRATSHVAEQIIRAARLTAETQTMGLAFGPSGIGKTLTSKALPNLIIGAVYLRVNQINRSPHALLTDLAAKVDGVAFHNTHRAFYPKLVQRLAHSGRLIIVDECQILAPKSFQVLRDLHDEAGVPILLIGIRNVYESILADAVPDAGQLYSRFGVIVNLVQGRDVHAGGKPLFTIEQIVQAFQTTPIRLAKDAAEYLRDVANALGQGSLRLCKRLVQFAARRARERQAVQAGEPITITAPDLQAVERLLKQEAGETDLMELRGIAVAS